MVLLDQWICEVGGFLGAETNIRNRCNMEAMGGMYLKENANKPWRGNITEKMKRLCNSLSQKFSSQWQQFSCMETTTRGESFFFLIYVGGSYRVWVLSEVCTFDLIHLLTARAKYSCQSTYLRTKLKWNSS